MFSKSLLVLTVACTLFSSAFTPNAAEVDRPVTQPEKKVLLDILSSNAVIRAARAEAIDAGEKCKSTVISATKPPQFEDGTVFQFEASISCLNPREKQVVRIIGIRGRAWRTANGGGIDPLIIKIERFD
jgi:hypothetical protein